MDLIEKARILIANWIDHGSHHQREYEDFAKQLEKAGKKASAEYIRSMAALTDKGVECLNMVHESLDKE